MVRLGARVNFFQIYEQGFISIGWATEDEISKECLEARKRGLASISD
jgi:hypothetical protein